MARVDGAATPSKADRRAGKLGMARKWAVIDRIWRSRGAVPVEPPLSPQEIFDRLSGLFEKGEFEIDRVNRRLDYRKPNPAAQDRLATFSNGSLEVAEDGQRQVVRYDVGSPALLLTFLAPLLFLALAQGFVLLGQWEESKEASQPEDEDEDDEKPGELHWIDQMLGAPEPEDPDEKDVEDEEEDDDYSPRDAYGLAALFALIYLVGRFLEPYLFRKTVRRTVHAGSEP